VGWHEGNVRGVRGLVYSSLHAAKDKFQDLAGGMFAAHVYAYSQADGALTLLDTYGSDAYASQLEAWAHSKLCSWSCRCTNHSAPVASVASSAWPPQPSLNCSGSCPCNASVGATSGSLSDGAGTYSQHSNCAWLVSGPTISLVFTSFDTESYFDVVTINRCSDAACSLPEQLDRLSGSPGSASSRTFVSSTGYLQVLFTSDGSTEKEGFAADWRIYPDQPTVTCTGGCACSPADASGAVVASGITMGVISDGDGSYGSNLKCEWVIGRGGAHVSLVFSAFQTASYWDSATIYRCQTPACDPPERQLARLSGDVGAGSVFSSEGFLKVVFHSDYSGSAQGFVGNWSIWEAVPAIVTCSGGRWGGGGGGRRRRSVRVIASPRLWFVVLLRTRRADACAHLCL